MPDFLFSYVGVFEDNSSFRGTLDVVGRPTLIQAQLDATEAVQRFSDKVSSGKAIVTLSATTLLRPTVGPSPPTGA